VSLAGDKESLYQRDHSASDTIFYDNRQAGVTTGPLDEESDLTQKMFDLIINAEKPLIIAGQGCNSCSQELMDFAQSLQIPVTTTLHALGCFDERHSLALNMVGMHGT
jgi:acetolactate synthase-1/2/3 large subunit